MSETVCELGVDSKTGREVAVDIELAERAVAELHRIVYRMRDRIARLASALETLAAMWPSPEHHATNEQPVERVAMAAVRLAEMVIARERAAEGSEARSA